MLRYRDSVAKISFGILGDILLLFLFLQVFSDIKSLNQRIGYAPQASGETGRVSHNTTNQGYLGWGRVRKITNM